MARPTAKMAWLTRAVSRFIMSEHPETLWKTNAAKLASLGCIVVKDKMPLCKVKFSRGLQHCLADLIAECRSSTSIQFLRKGNRLFVFLCEKKISKISTI